VDNIVAKENIACWPVSKCLRLIWESAELNTVAQQRSTRPLWKLNGQANYLLPLPQPLQQLRNQHGAAGGHWPPIIAAPRVQFSRRAG
jgi:hypothetical protein